MVRRARGIDVDAPEWSTAPGAPARACGRARGRSSGLYIQPRSACDGSVMRQQYVPLAAAAARLSARDRERGCGERGAAGRGVARMRTSRACRGASGECADTRARVAPGAARYWRACGVLGLCLWPLPAVGRISAPLCATRARLGPARALQHC